MNIKKAVKLATEAGLTVSKRGETEIIVGAIRVYHIPGGGNGCWTFDGYPDGGHHFVGNTIAMAVDAQTKREPQ